jgi:hypothetical protein
MKEISAPIHSCICICFEKGYNLFQKLNISRILPMKKKFFDIRNNEFKKNETKKQSVHDHISHNHAFDDHTLFWG